MRATNKRLLISESHGDSNRCTPYSGKPDQHNTYASHASPCMLGVCLLRVVPIRGNLSCSHQQIWTDPLPLKKKGSWHTSTARQLTNLWVRTQLLSHNSQWSSGEKSSFYWKLTTRITRPISPACGRYVQYLLAGANPSVLNWLRRGLQPWRCRLSTYHSPTFPTGGLHIPTKGPARSLV
jgi:hypothetical protein